MARSNRSIAAKLSPAIPENEPLKYQYPFMVETCNRLQCYCSSVVAGIDLIYLAIDLITRHTHRGMDNNHCA